MGAVFLPSSQHDQKPYAICCLASACGGHGALPDAAALVSGVVAKSEMPFMIDASTLGDRSLVDVAVSEARCRKRRSRVGVIGLGYVGLPLA